MSAQVRSPKLALGQRPCDEDCLAYSKFMHNTSDAPDRSEHAVVTSSLAAYDAFFGSRPNSLFAHILQTFMRPKGSSYISSPPSFILFTQSTSPATLNMKTSFAILAAAVSFVSASVIVIDTDAHAQVDVDLNTRTTGCRQCMCRSSSNSIII